MHSYMQLPFVVHIWCITSGSLVFIFIPYHNYLSSFRQCSLSKAFSYPGWQRFCRQCLFSLMRDFWKSCDRYFKLIPYTQFPLTFNFEEIHEGNSLSDGFYHVSIISFFPPYYLNKKEFLMPVYKQILKYVVNPNVAIHLKNACLSIVWGRSSIWFLLAHSLIYIWPVAGAHFASIQ